VKAATDPRIVLHVGAPKTASTYLQRRLRANAERLRKHGIFVPVLPQVAAMAGNAKLLATALSQRPSLTFQRAFPEIDHSELNPAKLVSDLLRDWKRDSESVVLSAENLRPNHAAHLRELLPSDVAIVVILLIRRQDRWIDSYFNQMAKTSEEHRSMSDFVAQLCNTEGERFCRPDWFAHYQAWKNAFGNCTIIFYDEVASDVFSALLNAAGFEAAPDLIDIDRAQVSLNIFELAYLLELKKPITYEEFLRRRMAGEKASRKLGLHETRSILSEADLARLRNRFDDSNRRLLSAIGRDGSTLLELDANTSSDLYCNLLKFYDSADYVDFRKRADAIYARRNRRDRFRSLFKPARRK
jgi:hypothetical protein